MSSPGQYFTSPGGFSQAQPGQASKNEQDDFHDPSGKYKLVMKGEFGTASKQPYATAAQRGTSQPGAHDHPEA